MASPFSRREFIRRGALAAGVAAGAPMAALAVPSTTKVGKSAPSLPVAIQRSASYEPDVVLPALKPRIGPDWRSWLAGAGQDGDHQAQSDGRTKI